jgi:tubulin alpha
MLYKNRAFCHWFLDEGMLEEDFLMAREQIAALQNDYKDILGVTTSQDDEDFTTTF